MISSQAQAPEAGDHSISCVKRRVRHLHTISIHNLTLTPHKDELLASTSPVVQQRKLSAEGGRPASELCEGVSGSFRWAVDDLDLGTIKGGRNRASSVTKALDAAIPILSTSPTTTISSATLHHPPDSPSSSFLVPSSTSSNPRPSLIRARASSRRRLSSASFAPSPTSPGVPDLPRSYSGGEVGRARSSSRVSLGSFGADTSGGTGFPFGQGSSDPIKEDGETLELSTSLENSLDAPTGEEDDPDEPLEFLAARRLLESFITLRITDEAARELYARVELSEEKEREKKIELEKAEGGKGKGKERAPSSSASIRPALQSSTSSRLKARTSSSLSKDVPPPSRPAGAALPRRTASSPSTADGPSSPYTSTTRSALHTRSSTSPSLAPPPSASPSRPTSSLRPSLSTISPSTPSRKLRPRTSSNYSLPTIPSDADYFPSNTNQLPSLSQSPPSTPLSSRVPSLPDLSTPLYISPLHPACSSPTFADLDPTSDFGGWDGKEAWRNEQVVVGIWVRESSLAGRRKSKGKEKEGSTREWRLLKDQTLDLGRLKVYKGKNTTPLPPNTILVSLSSSPSTLLYLPSILPSGPEVSIIHRSSSSPTLDLHALPSARLKPDLSASILTPTSTGIKPKAPHQPEREWSDQDSALARSLLETRMKRSLGFSELLSLANLEAVLIDTSAGLVDVRTSLESTLEEKDRRDGGGEALWREVMEREARVGRMERLEEEGEEELDKLLRQVEVLRSDLEQREANLIEARKILSAQEHDRTPMLQAQIHQQKSDINSLQPHFRTALSHHAHILLTLFPITSLISPNTPSASHTSTSSRQTNLSSSPTSILFSVLSLPLPLPIHPSSPTPPLSLSASELPPGVPQVDEDGIASALGYVAIMLERLGEYMGRKGSGGGGGGLKYPVVCKGSRSLIKDLSSDVKGLRIFPLYSRGAEKYRFEYAVFLLNKNIELLMTDHGIRIMDPRHTLPNLMNLLLTLSSDLPSGSTSTLKPSSRISASSDPKQTQPNHKPLSSVFHPILEDEPLTTTSSPSSSPLPTPTTTRTTTSSDPTPTATPTGSSDSPTPNALSRSIFWALGGGGSTKSTPAVAAIEKKRQNSTETDRKQPLEGESDGRDATIKARPRRGTLARVLGGSGSAGGGAGGGGGGGGERKGPRERATSADSGRTVVPGAG